MKDINTLYNKDFFKAENKLFFLVALFIINIACVMFAIYLFSTNNETALTLYIDYIKIISAASGVILFINIIINIISIFRQSMFLSNKKPSIGNIAFVIFLSLTFFISMPYIQSKLNLATR